MIVTLVVVGYIVVLALDFPPIYIKKEKKQITFYLILMSAALALSILLIKFEDFPSAATIIKNTLAPILKLLKVLP